MDSPRPRAQVVIAGAGPAGMVLGLLLARSGIEVELLEKHADFLRDFRGDTIHPSTLELMHELGLLEDLLRLPHQKVPRIEGRFAGLRVAVDFGWVPARCRYVAFMPQWHFLDFLAERARRYPSFRLRLGTEALDLLRDGPRVAGVRVRGPAGEEELRAGLVVAADGRASVLRAKAGLRVRELGAPMDVLWFRLPRRPGDPETPTARFEAGGGFLMLNQGTHWQCGCIIRKGGFEALRARGLAAFKASAAAYLPPLADRLGELKGWDEVKLLTVKVDRLERWHLDGLLCIGDAAHAMSPVGGVGINLAIQDAVAAANLLVPVLRRGRPAEEDLARVQRRRAFPTWATQRLQVFVQDRLISRMLAASPEEGARAPWPVRLAATFPILGRVPARVIGIGFRPEHVRTEPA